MIMVEHSSSLLRAKPAFLFLQGDWDRVAQVFVERYMRGQVFFAVKNTVIYTFMFKINDNDFLKIIVPPLQITCLTLIQKITTS